MGGKVVERQLCVGFGCSVDGRGVWDCEYMVGGGETYAGEARAARPMRRVLGCMVGGKACTCGLGGCW